MEASFDGSVETSLIEEEKDDDGSMEEDASGRGTAPCRAVAQGQTVLNDSMNHSNGSAYSVLAVPGSNDLIPNHAANEDKPDDKQRGTGYVKERS
jgi:hypothetical protein